MDEDDQRDENLINNEEHDGANDYSLMSNNNCKKLKLEDSKAGDEDEHEDDQEDNECDEDVIDSMTMMKSNKFNESVITNEKVSLVI